MKIRILLAAAAVVAVTGCTTHAAERQSQGNMTGREMMMGQMMMQMNRADVNADGALSKEEFLKAHEAMFDQMKNKEGLVRLDSMPAHCAQMMQGGHGMMGGGMMKNGRMGDGMMPETRPTAP